MSDDSDSLPIFILFFLESCLDIGFSVCISIKFMNNDRFSSVWETMSSSLAYLFAVALVVAPIYLIIAGKRLHKAVQQNDPELIKIY